jgi:hypothetical protein
MSRSCEAQLQIVDTRNIRPNGTLTIGAGAPTDPTFHLIERFTCPNLCV